MNFSNSAKTPFNKEFFLYNGNRGVCMRLHTKLMLGISILIIIMGTIIEFTFKNIMESNLKHEIGTKALSVALTIANMPEIQAAFHTEHPSALIQPLAEKIRNEVGAEFIVVGNRNEIRYSHPNPNRI